MSVLIAVGVLAAYVASAYLTIVDSKELFYEAAAMLVTFVLFGHWMEMKSRRGSSDALHALFNLVPPKARVLRNDVGGGAWRRGRAAAWRPRAVDGEVVEGTTSMDESLVTGESLPVEKKPGTKVVGGSVNGAGSVKFKATGVGEETTLARIAKLVETAQNSKAPGQRLADRAASYLLKGLRALRQDIVTAAGVDENEAMNLLAAAERGSSHPLAAAVLEEAKRRNLNAND